MAEKLSERLRHHADWLRHEEMDTTTIEEAAAELDRREARLTALERALTSIANSSCCGCCQEAALVAKAALVRNTHTNLGLCGALNELTGAVCILPTHHSENHRGEFAHGIAQWPAALKG